MNHKRILNLIALSVFCSGVYAQSVAPVRPSASGAQQDGAAAPKPTVMLSSLAGPESGTKEEKAAKSRSISFSNKLSVLIEALLNLQNKPFRAINSALFDEQVNFDFKGTASEALAEASHRYNFTVAENNGVVSVYRPDPFRLYEVTYKVRHSDIVKRSFRGAGSTITVTQGLTSSSSADAGAASAATDPNYSATAKAFTDAMDKIVATPVTGFHLPGKDNVIAEEFTVVPKVVNGYFVFNDVTQTIVFVGSQQQHEAVERLLSIYDVAKKQVRFRIDTITLSADADATTGVDWDGVLSANFKATSTATPFDLNHLSSTRLPGGGTLSMSDLELKLSALDHDSRSCSVTTQYKTYMVGEKASLTNQSNKYVVLGSTSAVGGVSASSNQLSSVSAGDKLEFVATVFGDDKNPVVQINGISARGSFTGQTNASTGLSDTAEANTNINSQLRIGRALCIADQITNSQLDKHGGIPLLKEIPYLGDYVFGWRSTVNTKSRTLTIISPVEVVAEFADETKFRNEIHGAVSKADGIMKHMDSEKIDFIEKGSTQQEASKLQGDATALTKVEMADDEARRETEAVAVADAGRKADAARGELAEDRDDARKLADVEARLDAIERAKNRAEVRAARAKKIAELQAELDAKRLEFDKEVAAKNAKDNQARVAALRKDLADRQLEIDKLKAEGAKVAAVAPAASEAHKAAAKAPTADEEIAAIIAAAKAKKRQEAELESAKKAVANGSDPAKPTSVYFEGN